MIDGVSAIERSAIDRVWPRKRVSPITRQRSPLVELPLVPPAELARIRLVELSLITPAELARITPV